MLLAGAQEGFLRRRSKRTSDLEVCHQSLQIWGMLFFLVSNVGKGHGGLYKAPNRKKEESERLSEERDQIKFIDLGFERWQVIRFRKARGRQGVP